MHDIIVGIQNFLVIALVSGIIVLLVYGYKQYLEPNLLRKATADAEQKLARISGLNNTQLIDIKKAAEIISYQTTVLLTAVETIDINQISVGNLTIVKDNMKNLGKGLYAVSNRLDGKTPSAIAAVLNATDPRKAGLAEANSAGYYGSEEKACQAFANAITNKFPQVRNLGEYLALPKEERAKIAYAVRKNNVGPNIG